MKTVNRFSMLLIVLLISVATPKATLAQDYDVNFQVFYDNLSPYGTWVMDQNYGYVWIPDVDPGFQPYATNGHWVYTVYGWTWISDYPWGWAPFHYGRWTFDPMYGSIWIPGNEWGPAWVTWRHANGYYGWAPMGPGVNINIAITNYSIPANYWVFVPDRYLYRPDFHRYCLNPRENVTIINNSTVINNTYIDHGRNITYISGPDRREIQRETGQKIRQVQVRDAGSPSQRMIGKDQVQLYRPRVESRAGDNRRVAPSRVARYQDVKPVNERRSSDLRQERAGTQQVGNQQNANQRNGNQRVDVKRQPTKDTRVQQDQQKMRQSGNDQRFQKEQPRDSRQMQMQTDRERQQQERMVQERNNRQQELRQQQVQRQKQQVDQQQNQVREQPKPNASKRDVRQGQPERQQPSVRQQTTRQPAAQRESRLENRTERNSRQQNGK
ncbi:MAG: DUF6600 domain-containing protein [Syntrophothermus sp.]